MTFSPTEAEQQDAESYEQLASGSYVITEKFPDSVRSELLLESRDVINFVVENSPNDGVLYESNGQSGQINILGLGETPDTVIGIRVSKATDGDQDGALTVYKSAYAETTKDNPAIAVTFGPTGTVITSKSLDATLDAKVAVPEKEAIAFARDMMKKVRGSIETSES